MNAATMTGLLTPEQIVEAGLAASRTDGCVVVVHSSSQANVRWANNTVTTNGVSTSVAFYVVAVTGAAAATVSGSAGDATSAAGVAAVVRAAEAAAAAAAAGGPARDAMALFAPERGGRDGDTDGSFSDGPVPTSFGVYSTLLAGLAAAFDDARGGGRVLYGFARHEMTTVHLGTSTGVRRRWVQPTGTMELNAKSEDLSRSSWAGLSTVDFSGVDVTAMAATLSDRLEWSRRRVDLPPGRYDTVLPPTAVADFMVYLAWSAGARAAHEGRSAFAAPSRNGGAPGGGALGDGAPSGGVLGDGAPGGGTRIGERLSDRRLVLYSDPTEAGLECAPFVETPHSSDEVSVFDSGAPAGRIEFVRDGAISHLVQTRASAAEYGAPFTPVVDNLVLAGGDQRRTTADLVAGVDRGLLVTSQWYLREVDPMTLLLTGLTRDGVFLIEHGEITAAVNNFRFNVSPLDVLRRGVDVGRTERCLSREWSDWFTRSAMPSIRVEGFHMSSVSKAL